MALQEHSSRFYLASCRTPHSKTEEGRRFGISLYFEFCKSCCMAFYRLGDFSVNRVQLHCTNHPILLEKERSAFREKISNVCSKTLGTVNSKAANAFHPLLQHLNQTRSQAVSTQKIVLNFLFTETRVKLQQLLSEGLFQLPS